VAQVIVEASDDAFGFLQLSAPAVSVAEYYVGPIINVTRTGGIFADVSVKFRAVPMTARVGKSGLHFISIVFCYVAKHVYVCVCL
jgi:G-protein coupled receptor 98